MYIQTLKASQNLLECICWDFCVYECYFQVKVGDKEVDVMKGFTLYVTTKLANPTYTPEVGLLITLQWVQLNVDNKLIERRWK